MSSFLLLLASIIIFTPLVSIIAVYVNSLRRLQPVHSLAGLLRAQLPELLYLEALLQLVILLTLAINLLPGSIWLLIQLSHLLYLQQMIFFIKAPLVLRRSSISRTIGALSLLILLAGWIWGWTEHLTLSQVGLTKLAEVGSVALLQELLL